MKDNLTDLNKFKAEKALREADKNNLELLKKLEKIMKILKLFF